MAINEDGVPARETPFNGTEKAASSPAQKISGDIEMSKGSLVTILICTGLSVIFMRSGFLSFFYLAPLGFAVIVTRSIWFTFFSAAGVNIMVDFFSRASSGNSGNMAAEIFYFSSMFLLFIWIIGAKNPRTAYRLTAGSAAGAVIFAFLFFKTNFFSFFDAFVEELSALAASDDELMNSGFYGLLPKENMKELFNSLFLRGAALFSVLFTFFINRHLAYALVRLVKKRREDKPLTAFFAPQNAVWILLSSLISILIAGSLKIEPLEILAWNVFIVYAMMFLAQGAGIVTHLLSRSSSVFRLASCVFIVFVLLSPLSPAVIIMLLLLGVIECWIPIRMRKVSP